MLLTSMQFTRQNRVPTNTSVKTPPSNAYTAATTSASVDTVAIQKTTLPRFSGGDEKKSVYLFREGDKSQKALLGGKGANLAEMTNLGLPVPPGFTITTDTCMDYLNNGEKLSDRTKDQVDKALKSVERQTHKKFGNPKNPLLVSVRSGAPISMPGMMDTILNVGLNDRTVEGLAQQTGNPRFAFDSYRRLISMFGNVVYGIDSKHFEHALAKKKQEKGVIEDTQLDATDLKSLIQDYKAIFEQHAGRPFPQNPQDQLNFAMEAVFKSWNTERAKTYRAHEGIPNDMGTAVNIQAMVFGNMGDNSATGVCFSRNPATGAKGLYGDYLVNAQGEDVVAGIRTPEPIAQMRAKFPAAYAQLVETVNKLEHHNQDMQDIEFTIENGQLYFLQTRNGKRTANAAVEISVALVNEGILTKQQALLSIDANQLPQLLLPAFDPDAKKQNQSQLLAKGLNASPGAATGKIVFDADTAKRWADQGKSVILVRPETTTDDIHGFYAAKGILTLRGGNTSHAAVVARGMGKPAVTGCGDLLIDEKTKTLKAGKREFREGDVISIDGTTGEVFPGKIEVKDPDLKTLLNPDSPLGKLLSWSDQFRKIGVQANADTPEDARRAEQLGAKGIGLCRTEHMFMAKDRLPVMKSMILATTPEEEQKYLNQLGPMQYEDFKGIFKAMNGYPVTIRLLDPPLHEFLPKQEDLIEEVTRLRYTAPNSPEFNKKSALLAKVKQLHESNPMLGLRGCRLGLVRPEITKMQVRAILEAAADVARERVVVKPKIMIPLIATRAELSAMRKIVEETAAEVAHEKGTTIPYQFGTMIETPRAALNAGDIAEDAEFFSIGSNDLTQMTWGLSRDDVENSVLRPYKEAGIIETSPFETLDPKGVGKLIKKAVKKGRVTNPNLEVGLCGEHGGDAKSVELCDRMDINYVSASPYRVLVSRVAGAQSAIRNEKEQEEQPKAKRQKKS